MTQFQQVMTMVYTGAAVAGVTFFVSPARAGNTAVLPKGVFALDVGRIQADTRVRWDETRTARPLIEGLQRYEPGGGLQGTITANPFVRYEFVTSQLFYGVTDDLTAAVALPWVTRTTIDPKLGWIPGDYQSGMGRAYTEDDFWQWAESMGQRKLTAFDGNRGAPSDMVIGLRWRIPEAWTSQFAGVAAGLSAQVALPTGVDPDPEELVAGGTKVWDLHNYGDAEVHASLERPWREGEVNRANVGLDLHYAWLRERAFVTPKGSKNPLLLTYAPYVGPTYKLDPGDMVGFSLLGEFAPWIGPARPVWIARGDADVAAKFPPVVNLIAAYTFAHVGQSVWQSKSDLWNWERMRLWQPGDKNTVKLTLELSLMRFGLPLQLYGGYRNQEWVPGKNTRASNVAVGGARLLLKFW